MSGSGRSREGSRSSTRPCGWRRPAPPAGDRAGSPTTRSTSTRKGTSASRRGPPPAARKAPANVSIWIALADAQTALKNPSGTIDALRQATKADPDSFDANHRLARLLQDDGRHADAAALFERAVAR